jgi:hypothetical protein
VGQNRERHDLLNSTCAVRRGGVFRLRAKEAVVEDEDEATEVTTEKIKTAETPSERPGMQQCLPFLSTDPERLAPTMVTRSAGVTVRAFFAWYDLWVGAYWDQKERTLYVCPIPTVGVKITIPRLWKPSFKSAALIGIVIGLMTGVAIATAIFSWNAASRAETGSARLVEAPRPTAEKIAADFSGPTPAVAAPAPARQPSAPSAVLSPSGSKVTLTTTTPSSAASDAPSASAREWDQSRK